MITIPNIQLSPNFWLNEFEVSASHPSLVVPVPVALHHAVERLAKTCLQPIRDYWGRAIMVLSGYRSATLNAKVKGSETSQHRVAEAADIHTEGVRDLFAALVAGDVSIPCGQVIYYPSDNFIHVAIPGARYNIPSLFVSRHAKKYEPVRSIADLGRLGV